MNTHIQRRPVTHNDKKFSFFFLLTLVYISCRVVIFPSLVRRFIFFTLFSQFFFYRSTRVQELFSCTIPLQIVPLWFHLVAVSSDCSCVRAWSSHYIFVCNCGKAAVRKSTELRHSNCNAVWNESKMNQALTEHLRASTRTTTTSVEWR